MLTDQNIGLFVKLKEVETKTTGKYQIRGKVHDLDCLARESLMKAFKIRYTMF